MCFAQRRPLPKGETESSKKSSGSKKRSHLFVTSSCRKTVYQGPCRWSHHEGSTKGCVWDCFSQHGQLIGSSQILCRVVRATKRRQEGGARAQTPRLGRWEKKKMLSRLSRWCDQIATVRLRRQKLQLFRVQLLHNCVAGLINGCELSAATQERAGQVYVDCRWPPPTGLMATTVGAPNGPRPCLSRPHIQRPCNTG